LMGALGSAAGGLVLGRWGFPALNLLGALIVAGSLVAAWAWRPARATPPPSDARPSTL
jgi:predicted MFS family arabinose efflux permease